MPTTLPALDAGIHRTSLPNAAHTDFFSRLHKHLDHLHKRPLDRNLERDLQHGWLIPHLLHADDLLWHRWDHWAQTQMAGEVLPDPIPQIAWGAHPAGRKMWEKTLDAVTPHGGWQGWSGWENMNYALDWLLFGFGHHGHAALPREPHPGASMRLYQTFCLQAALAYPHDYLGDMLAENAHGKHRGFYPTPMEVTNLMAGMLFGPEGSADTPVRSDSEAPDPRLQTVCDPCVGTGRMLLAASNYSYRLYAMDIDETVLKACLINGYLYAPWMVKPFPFLDRALTDPAHSAALSDRLHANAPIQALSYLNRTLHDADLQPQVEPLKARKKLLQLDLPLFT